MITRFLAALAAAMVVSACGERSAASPAPARSSSLFESGAYSIGSSTAIGRRFGRSYAVDANRVVSLGGGGLGWVVGNESIVDVYDVSHDSWTSSPAGPFAAGGAGYVGQIDAFTYLMFGGGNAIPHFGVAPVPDHSSWLYDLHTNSWTRTQDVPPGLLSASVVNTELIRLQDGRLLAAGGLDESAAPSAVSLVFTYDGNDPAASRWDYTRDARGNPTQMAHPHEHHTSRLLADGRVLLAGGFDRTHFDLINIFPNSATGAAAEIFDPRTGQWTSVPNMPAIDGEEIAGDVFPGSRQQALSALLADGRVLICGGASVPIAEDGSLLGDPNYLGESERTSCLFFNPAQIGAPGGPWRLAAPMPTGRTNGALVDLGMRGLLVYGGFGTAAVYQLGPIPGWNGVPETFLYDQTNDVWLPGGDMPWTDLGDGSGRTPLVLLPSSHGAVLPNGKVIIPGGFFSLLTFSAPAAETQIYDPGLPLTAVQSSASVAARGLAPQIHQRLRGR